MTDPNDGTTPPDGGQATPAAGTAPDGKPETPPQESVKPEEIAEYRRLKKEFEELQVQNPRELVSEFTRRSQALAEKDRTIQQWEQHWEEHRRRSEPKADPLADSRRKLAAARFAQDDESYAQAVAEHEDALARSIAAQLKPEIAAAQRNALSVMDARQLASRWGVTEKDMTETLAAVGHGDMESLAKLAAIRKGTYGKAEQRDADERKRDARLAEVLGGQADGRPRGPAGPGEEQRKGSYNPFVGAEFCRGDGSVVPARAKALRSYLDSLDPASVPAHVKEALERASR